MTCSSAVIVSQCIKSLNKLLNQTYPDRDEDISRELAILKVELVKDLTIRVYAGKQGLYSLLISCLRKMEDSYLLQILETLTGLMSGYPDLLDKSGLEFMVAFLHINVDLDLIIQNLKWIKNCVSAHEKNRCYLLEMKIQDFFRNLLQTFNDKPRLVIQICQVIKKLVTDDDGRVINGNSHEHARAIANETLCIFISFLQVYSHDVCVLHELIPAITALTVREEFCIKIYEQNGIHLIIDAMVKYADDERISRYCLLLLKALAGSDVVKGPIVQNGAAPFIVSAVYRHKISPSLVAAGFACISSLALRSPSNRQTLIDASSPEMLISLMNMYKDNLIVLKNGCWAIRNIVARSNEFRQNFAVLGVDTLLNESRRKFEKELDYEARMTLRDLGCEIEDEYSWPKMSY